MSDQCIEFSCHNRPIEGDNTFECYAKIAGPMVETLKAHNWSKPFIDIRFCPKCRMYWKITIMDLDSPMLAESVAGRINFVLADNMMPAVIVKGRKVLRKQKT